MRRKLLIIGSVAVLSLVGCSSNTEEVTTNIEESTVDVVEDFETVEETIENKYVMDLNKALEDGFTDMYTTEEFEIDDVVVSETLESTEETESKVYDVGEYSWTFSNINAENLENITKLNDAFTKALNTNGIITVTQNKKEYYILFTNNNYEKVMPGDAYETITKKSNGWLGTRYLYKSGTENIDIESKAVSGLDLEIGFYEATFELLDVTDEYMTCAYNLLDGSTGNMNVVITEDILSSIEFKNSTYKIDFEGSNGYNDAVAKFNEAKSKIKE